MRSGTYYTTCPYNCWPVNCGMEVRVDEAGGLSLRGNPHHDVSRGRLCVKGQSALEIELSAHRLTTPLLRDGPRGAGRFRPILWDEALDRIAERLVGNIAAGRREANALYHSHGNIVQRVNWKILTPRFANLAGLTLWDGNFPCWYDVGVAQKLTGYFGLHDPADMGSHSRAVINWAQDPCASQANLVPYLLEVRDRGGVLVTIDPRVTQTAALSDLHLRPRPGTDVHLANAVAHLLIAGGKHDAGFVEPRTLGFEAYREHLRAYTPARAAVECGLAVREIERLAAIFAEHKPLCVNLTRGALGKHAGGIQMVRAILCLVAVSGNVGIRGGGAIWGEAVDFDLGLQAAERRPFAPYTVNNFTAIDDALERGAVDTLLVVGGNPLSQWPELGRLRHQLARVGLVVINDLFLSHTAREAGDIVLPATSWLEELGLRTSNRRIYLMDRILAPPGSCREASAWMSDLATRLGIGGYFPWATKEECLDACLSSPACADATVARLRERPEGIAARVPEVPYADGAFETPSGKLELFSSTAAELGLAPLPTHEPARDEAAAFPLRLISSRRNTHFHSFHDSHRHLATLRALEPEPLLQLHPRDAAARGIADGDLVEMRSAHGRSEVRAELTTEVLEGHVSLNDGWPELNEVTAARAACPVEVTRALGLGGQPTYQDTRVEVRRVAP